MSNSLSETTYAVFRTPQNKKLISELAARHADLLIFPEIKTEKIELTEEARKKIKNIGDYDWLIFPDVFAVDYFIEALEDSRTDLFELDHARICACGEAVSDRLRFVQVHADVIPTKLDEETIFSNIYEYAGAELNDLRFLFPQELNASHAISEKLKNAQADFEELPVYRAFFEEEKENLKLKTLLKGGAVDEMLFSSTEDLISLRFLFTDESPAEILQDIKVYALNEQVFQTLLENNLRPLYYHPK